MFIKRVFDFTVSFIGLLILSPLLLIILFLVWWQDKHSPFYIAPRVGKDRKIFKMVKIRSMVMNADKSGVDSTSSNDNRITPVGHFVRNYKLDELMQLWNVFLGHMSLVGPRPQVERDVLLYTDEEKKILNVKPGITDFSSIIFSDEGEILSDKEDPDLAYNQIIRPWKSRYCLFYIEKRSFWLDIKLIYYTIIAIISKNKALNYINSVLKSLNADKKLIDIAKRENTLTPYPPPGSNEVVKSR